MHHNYIENNDGYRQQNVRQLSLSDVEERSVTDPCPWFWNGHVKIVWLIDWLTDGAINTALYAIITVSMDWTSRCFTWIYSTVLQTTLQCWHWNWRWLWLWWRSAKSCITQFWASYCYIADTDIHVHILHKYDLCAIIMQHFLLPHRWSMFSVSAVTETPHPHRNRLSDKLFEKLTLLKQNGMTMDS